MIDRAKAHTWSKERIIEEIADLRSSIIELQEENREAYEDREEYGEKYGEKESFDISGYDRDIVRLDREVYEAKKNIEFLKSLL